MLREPSIGLPAAGTIALPGATRITDEMSLAPTEARAAKAIPVSYSRGCCLFLKHTTDPDAA
jgi:hypothetical protein